MYFQQSLLLCVNVPIFVYYKCVVCNFLRWVLAHTGCHTCNWMYPSSLTDSLLPTPQEMHYKIMIVLRNESLKFLFQSIYMKNTTKIGHILKRRLAFWDPTLKFKFLFHFLFLYLFRFVSLYMLFQLTLSLKQSRWNGIQSLLSISFFCEIVSMFLSHSVVWYSSIHFNNAQ